MQSLGPNKCIGIDLDNTIAKWLIILKLEKNQYIPLDWFGDKIQLKNISYHRWW